MKLDNIKHSTQRLNDLVDGWQTNGDIPRIERDMALDVLRRLYDQLLDIDTDKVAVVEDAVASEAIAVAVAQLEEQADSIPESVAADDSKAATLEPEAATIVEDSNTTIVEEEEDLLDIEALLGISSTEEVTPAEKTTPVEAVAADVAPANDTVVERDEVAPMEESAPEESVVDEGVKATSGELFAMEDIPVTKSGGRKIISLYSGGATAAASVAASAVTSTASAAVASAAESVAAPVAAVEEQPKRLADVLGGDRKVLGDKIVVDDKPTTPFNRISDLRKAIGINDKFLMIKDLFGGNAAKYEATIDVLNEFEDLDDCIIYIAENFAWNPDSEGAKLLMSLIERKLS